MKSNKMFLVFAMLITGVLGIGLGVTYAWYAYDNAKTDVTGRTASENPTVIFSQTDEILYRNILPIYDDDRYNYAGKNSFSVTIGEKLKNYTSGVEISLGNIIISEELKNANFKYELLENNQVIASGDFSNIGNNKKMTLKPMSTLQLTEYPTTINYDLYIWLSENEDNQNNLMNKVFSAKVNVDSAVKK